MTFFYKRKKKFEKFNGRIPIASVVNLLSSSKDSPLEELTLPVVEFKKKCQEMVQLFQALGNHKLLQTFEICHPKTASRGRILSIASKEELVLQKQLTVCLKSLMQLLNCASVKIEKLEIHDVVAFQDCSTCGSSGENTVKSLCEFLGKCKNIEYVSFHGCYLKGKAMRSILSSLSKS